MDTTRAINQLEQSGFKFSHWGIDRAYFTRTDGHPEVFYDHSATLSRIGMFDWHVSDFLHRAPHPGRSDRTVCPAVVNDLWLHCALLKMTPKVETGS